MLKLFKISPRRIGAIVCVALALVFLQSGAASILNGVQHLSGNPDTHEHALFSNISLDDDDNHSGLHSGHESHGGHHHHHGDINTGMAAFAASGMMAPVATGDRNQLGHDHVRVLARQSLPERPPRA